MRAIVLLAACAALLAFTAVDARRIHRLSTSSQLTAAAADDSEVSVGGPKEDFEAASAALNGAVLTAAQIRTLFNENLIRIAADQGKPVRRQVGTYESTGVRRICNNGVCGEWGADYTYRYGNKGIVTAVYNAATSSAPERVDFEFNYWWPSCQYGVYECQTHLICPAATGPLPATPAVPINAGSTPCAFSQYQDAEITDANGYKNLMGSAPKISQSEQSKYVKRNDIKVTSAGVLVVREYYEPNAKELRHTIRHIRGVWGPVVPAPTAAAPRATAPAPLWLTGKDKDYGADGDYMKALSPAVSDILVAAEKSKRLTTAEILAKFFTADNIDLARMQSSSTPVKAVIGAYNTGVFLKSCTGGMCTGGWRFTDLLQAGQFGGDGSVSLSCTVPSDLTKSKCDVTWTMKGGYGWEYQTFTTCTDIGNVAQAGGPICSTSPTYFGTQVDRSTDRSFWSRQDFVRGTVEAQGAYFTPERLVAVWKYKGVPRDDKQPFAPVGHVVYTRVVAYTTPFGDFGQAPKTNCLSKATVKDVLTAAQEKIPKNNRIVLKEEAVAELIKGAAAPYKTVDEAITKVKGIGPVNIVYVSFKYNVLC